MANALDLLDDPKIVAMIVGWPGSAKTGSVAALLNAGYKVRMIDFEGNYLPLLRYTKKEFLKNLDIVTLQDKLSGDSSRFIEPEGIPTAFADALKLLNGEWKYTGKDGKEVNLGRSKEWGRDTVLLIDSLTANGEASMRRARKMMNKTVQNTTAAVWGAAVDDQIAMIQALKHEKRQHHLIYLAHLQMVGPEVPMLTRDDDINGTKDIKLQIAEERADLISTRLYPRAVTRNASTVIAKEFPTVILAERKATKSGVKFSLRTAAGSELDLKAPGATIAAEYPIETGLADIFKELGAVPPVKSKGAK